MLTRHEQVPTGLYVRSVIVVSAFGVGALWLMRRLLDDGLYLLSSAVAAVTIFLVLVYLRRRYSAMRWMAIGIGITVLFAVYPILYNLYIGFTNMGSGHLFTKEQAIERLEDEQYLPQDAPTFRWLGYRKDDSFALLLVSDDGAVQFATDDGSIETLELTDPEAEQPGDINGYRPMATSEVAPMLDELADVAFGEPPTTIRVQSLREAAATVPRYRFDRDADAMVDLTDGTIYQAVEGSFVDADGNALIPGFMTGVGVDNFKRFLTNQNLRGPLTRALVWNFVFAFASVALAFSVGLTVAMLFEDLPGRRWIRALLIVPYPIPVLVSVLIWRSMLNPDLGTIGQFLARVFGSSPQFFLDPTWTRIALIMVNIWLSYPYFYVISSGAMRSISTDMLDAAEVDGASPWQEFRFISLPQILMITMPLLIASFSFNFNNFNLIFIFNNGNPPMAGTVIPIGHTDILISFIYKLAFVSSSTSDYGLGAAISVLLFVVVGSVTYFQIRATKALEAR